MEVYHTARGNVPYIKVSARIMGAAQIEAWRAMMGLHGRRSHELAADIILEAVQAAQENPEVTDLIRAIARSRRHLQVVEGDPPDDTEDEGAVRGGLREEVRDDGCRAAAMGTLPGPVRLRGDVLRGLADGLPARGGALREPQEVSVTARGPYILCADGIWRNPAHGPDGKLPDGFPPADPADYPAGDDEH